VSETQSKEMLDGLPGLEVKGADAIVRVFGEGKQVPALIYLD
jgi:hypothetical protein